jgi:glutaredoxin
MSDNQTPQVTVYSTSWCAFCHTEMQWLDKLGIPYVAKDVEADEAAMAELQSKNGGQYQGVPVTDIAGDVILGFNRPALQEALTKHGLQPTA